MSENKTKMGIRGKIRNLEGLSVYEYFKKHGIEGTYYGEDDIDYDVKVNEFVPIFYKNNICVDYLYVYRNPSYNEDELKVPFDELKNAIEKMKAEFNLEDSDITIFGYTYYGEEPFYYW